MGLETVSWRLEYFKSGNPKRRVFIEATEGNWGVKNARKNY